MLDRQGFAVQGISEQNVGGEQVRKRQAGGIASLTTNNHERRVGPGTRPRNYDFLEEVRSEKDIAPGWSSSYCPGGSFAWSLMRSQTIDSLGACNGTSNLRKRRLHEVFMGGRQESAHIR